MARVLHDDTLLADLLVRDRVHAAYALCDLEAPRRQHASFYTTDEPSDVIVLDYHPPSFRALWMTGHPELAAEVCDAIALPERFHFILRAEYLPVVLRRHRLEAGEPEPMLRMVVTADWFRPAESALSPERSVDVEALDAFYQGRVAAWDRSMADDGFYVVLREGDAIVAAAGTHVVSAAFGVAGVGNVFTLPSVRGRGAATALTSAVVAALLPDHSTVFLNVAAGNAPAVQVYKRLGFRVVEHLVEAVAIRDPERDARADR